MDTVVTENQSLSIRFAFYVILTFGTTAILYNIISLNKFTAPFQYRVYNSVEECPLVSQKLIGLTQVVEDYSKTAEINEGLNLTVKVGGSYEPTECRARYNLAIVVPYRDRHDHLKAFLANLHPFLQRQQLAYTIFIVEQSNSSPFNRGMMMNIGYVEALKTNQSFDCFYLHDVDLVPEDDRHTYDCPEEGKPRQMAVLVSSFGYQRIYSNHFGGVTGISTKDFQITNGFSNSYWGWGGEDDDFYKRVNFHDLTVTYHEPESEARYTMLFHKKAEPNPKRFELLAGADKRFATDGLNDLHYHLSDLQLKPLYTHILVDIQPKNVTTKRKTVEQAPTY